MTPATKYDRMQDALADYAVVDRIMAEEYCNEGYLIAAEAVTFPEDERADFIENEVKAYPESAQYLVAVSASYRLAELVKAEASAMERAA